MAAHTPTTKHTCTTLILLDSPLAAAALRATSQSDSCISTATTLVAPATQWAGLGGGTGTCVCSNNKACYTQ